MKCKGNMRRALPMLLAAVLWAEGTCGAVCAAEPGMPVEQAAGIDAAVQEETGPEGEIPEDDEGDLAEAEGAGRLEEEEAPAPEEGEVPAPDAGEETAGTEADKAETPGGADGSVPEPGEDETPGEEQVQNPEETGSTETEKKPGPAEDPAPGEEADVPETDWNPAPAEDISGNTISENTAEPEAAEIQDAQEEVADALGEPPLMTGLTGEGRAFGAGNAVFGAGSQAKTPSMEEIIARYEAYPWSLSLGNTFARQPSAKEPYEAGCLSDKSLENARNLMNFIRYVAGLSADVTLNESYTEMAQTGALLNAVNGQLSHTPVQPSGFPDDLFQKGYQGCSSSNIASGYSNIANALLSGWMYDGDDSNIDRMGHRRWVLNPSMTQTGFGAVNGYSAMYAFDRKGSNVTDFVAWPARNMPIELMNGTLTPWTISLGSDYGKTDSQKVSVTLQDLGNNKTYTFSGAKADGAFYVNTDGYGMPNCIIFRPNSVSYKKDSRFRVTVSGLQEAGGGNAPALTYDVNFFSLQDTPETMEGVKEILLDKKELHLLVKEAQGKTREQLSAEIKPANVSDKTLVWKSNNAAAATVDAKGLVQAVAVGEAEISATAANGVQAVCTVKVSDYTLASDSASFDPAAESLMLDLIKDTGGQKLTVQDGDHIASDSLFWQSENENIATVNSEGLVTPISAGETEIWVTIADMVTLSCQVKVADSSLPALQMREESCTLGVRRDAQGEMQGDTRQMKVYFLPADGKWKQVKWRTDREAVASVSESGLVTAKGKGTAKITATVVDEDGQEVVQNGKKAQASCTVTVQEEAVFSEVPQPVVLTNTQAVLQNVALPEGWNWQYPETALAQFAGLRSKKFAAVYQQEGCLPAKTSLEVQFVTVEKLSAGLQSLEGQTIPELKSGQTAIGYVNYFSEETLRRFAGTAWEDNAAYKACQQMIEQNLQWSSSNPAVAAVEPTGNQVQVTAKGPGTSTLKVQLKLGKKTFTTTLKVQVSGGAEALLIKSVDAFTLAAKRDPKEEDTYTAMLAAFEGRQEKQGNSKITLTLPGATKVGAKSSNANVAAVKKAAAEGEGFAVFLQVKGAGTAKITLTGNDAAKTARTIRLVVTDPEPGLGQESLTLNTLRSEGEALWVYPAKDAAGGIYALSGLRMAADQQSAQFTLTQEAQGSASGALCGQLKAKSGTQTGTYKVKVCVTAGGYAYELPLTVKVVASSPKCTVKQKKKLNLFYQQDESLLEISTEAAVERVSLTGCSDYGVVSAKDGNYYLQAKAGATVNSVKKGSLSVKLEGYPVPLAIPFTVGVEKKLPKLAWNTGKVTFYPNAGIQSVWVGLKTPAAVDWDSVKVEKSSGSAHGNYLVEVDQENGGLIVSGKNLNQAENFQMSILLRDEANWSEPISYKLSVKVNMGQPAIALGSKTLQLNGNPAYAGYDTAATMILWKDGGELVWDSKGQEKSLRVSVFCDEKDQKAKELVAQSKVAFSVTRGPSAQQYQRYQVSVRLNAQTAAPGTYKFIVQAARDGKKWKTPLTLKIVNTAPDQAVKLSAKGSIDVLNRENSFMTLTPSLKALNGTFVTETGNLPGGRTVSLTGRDAHLFEARWDETGTTIQLRARRGETLVTKYQYSVIPVIEVRNGAGEVERLETTAVKCKLKQGSVKVSAVPGTAQMQSGVYNSMSVKMTAALKGAPAPEIESVTLLGNTDAFSYVYEGDGMGTLTMRQTGNASKGKTYSLQLQVRLKEQADNVKPITVRYRVKVK